MIESDNIKDGTRGKRGMKLNNYKNRKKSNLNNFMFYGISNLYILLT